MYWVIEVVTLNLRCSDIIFGRLVVFDELASRYVCPQPIRGCKDFGLWLMSLGLMLSGIIKIVLNLQSR